MSANPRPDYTIADTYKQPTNRVKPTRSGSIDSPIVREDSLYVINEDGDVLFIKSNNIHERIPSGYYSTDTDRDGNPVLYKQNYEPRDLVRFPDGPQNIILEEIRKFNLLEKEYRAFGEAHKRGFLLYGTPGTGKSVTISMLMEHYMSAENHLAIGIGPDLEVVLQELQDYHKLLVIEDLNPRNAESILDFLDGSFQYQNLVVIATTNYIDQLPPSITQRPSRFDRVIEVGFPEARHREYYLKQKFPEVLAKYPNIVLDTEKMSIAQLKELAIATLLYDLDYKETIIRMKKKF